MTNEEIINKLRDDKHYYGEFGRQYISNSDIKTILYDPEQFGVPMDENENLARGRLFHQLMLEPDKVKDFPLYDGAVRNASYRQFLQENDLKFALKVSEADEVKAMVES